MGNHVILGISVDSENISNISAQATKKKGCDSEASYGTSTSKSDTILGKQPTYKQFKHFFLLPLFTPGVQHSLKQSSTLIVYRHFILLYFISILVRGINNYHI